MYRLSESRPVSRVLSWAIIHLGLLSPASSSNLPEDIAGHDIAFLFGLAPGGVYRATSCYQLRGALLPHHFTLTPCPALAVAGRYLFCCTFRRLTPPRRYLAPCPMEPGLSSFPPQGRKRDCLADSQDHCPLPGISLIVLLNFAARSGRLFTKQPVNITTRDIIQLGRNPRCL